ncbi:MAG: hypothetical protein IJ966_03945 [Bacilli bacterium]|nr:hypothetical protein [Bacilli bacterium]
MGMSDTIFGTYTKQNKSKIMAIVRDTASKGRKYSDLEVFSVDLKGKDTTFQKLIEDSIKKRTEARIAELRQKGAIVEPQDEIIIRLEVEKKEGQDILREVMPKTKDYFASQTEKFRKHISENLEELVRKEIAARTRGGKKLTPAEEIQIRREVYNKNRDRLTKEIMPDAFALCRQATGLVSGKFHYNVQVEAAAAMSGGAIAEMKTGEGKTLVQTLSAYLDAVYATSFKVDKKNYGSVHVITANEYLAKENACENSMIFGLLGLSCDYVEARNGKSSKIAKQRRQEAYRSDIVYGTAKTIGFNYLDDHQIMSKEERSITRPLDSAIIDEADDILIDQALTPLIITSSSSTSKELKAKIEREDEQLRRMYDMAMEFLEVNKLDCKIADQYEKGKSVETFKHFILFKDNGRVFTSDSLSQKIYDGKFNLLTPENKKYFGIKSESDEIAFYNSFTDILSKCVQAKYYYIEGKNYIVSANSKGEKEIVLIDQNTGRPTRGTKLREGLQEAIEAKEWRKETLSGKPHHLKRSKTIREVARVTYPDFLSQYSKVCGMTGTSDIEQFTDIYGLPTYEVPSRKPNIRIDQEGSLYPTLDAKYDAIVREVLGCKKTLQPVLIGTTNVRESDAICKKLAEAGIRFQRLDAVNNENEEGVVKKAGLLGMVTVATNMAGRGTDIKLGEGVREVGGLYVIGTSKNKNLRIDNQLRGRAARQGDPGKTKYFQSLEDDLVRTRYGPIKFKGIIDRFKKNGSKEPIRDKGIIATVDKCQEAQESKDKAARIVTEKFGREVSRQKNAIYEIRDAVLDASPKELADIVCKNIQSYVEHVVSEGSPAEVDAKIGHLVDLNTCYDPNNKKDSTNKIVRSMFSKLPASMKTMQDFEKVRTRLLNVIDIYWSSQLSYFGDLQKMAGFASLSQEDPFKEFEYKAGQMYVEMSRCIQNELITYAISDIPFGNYEIKQAEQDEDQKIIL